MFYWILMFIITLIVPGALLLIWNICPKEKNINKTSGYRSSRSMRNQSTWEFAQKRCAKNAFHMFLPALVLPIIIMPMVLHKTIAVIGWAALTIIVAQMMAFVYIVFFTERDLKKTFDENGNQR